MTRTYSNRVPELILYNGRIGIKQQGPEQATALAISAGEIIAVGSDRAVLHLASQNSKKVNLGGRLVVPGFIDTHIHFYEWALKRCDINLEYCSSLDGLLVEVAARASALPQGTWVMGQGWNEVE